MTTHHHYHARNKAFTLIELLVVVAIIGILVSLFVPVLSRVKERAKEAQCSSNLKEMGNAVAIYTSEHDGLLFGYYGGFVWAEFLEPYHANLDEVRYCPNAHEQKKGWGDHIHAWTYAGKYKGSYGMNGWFYGLDHQDGGAFYFGHQGYPENFFKNYDQAASDTPLFADCAWVDGWPQVTDSIPPTVEGTGKGEFGTYMGRFFINRHPQDSIMMAFADGHVEKVHLSNLWQQRWHAGYEMPEDPITY